MLAGCLETDGCEGEPLSNGCVRLGREEGKKTGGREEKRSRNDEEKGRKARKEKTDGREEESRVIDTSGHLKG